MSSFGMSVSKINAQEEEQHFEVSADNLAEVEKVFSMAE